MVSTARPRPKQKYKRPKRDEGEPRRVVHIARALSVVVLDGLKAGDKRLVWMAPCDCTLVNVTIHATTGLIVVPLVNNLPMMRKIGVRSGVTEATDTFDLKRGDVVYFEISHVDGESADLAIAWMVQL